MSEDILDGLQYATDEQLLEYEELMYEDLCFESETDFTKFMEANLKGIDMTEFHKTYFVILDMFAHGLIKKLIISVPPQHGKSEGSSRKLPPFIHGIRPDTKIGLLSYSGPFAQKFNRDIKRTLCSQTYKDIFPITTINERSVVTAQGWKNTKEEYEVIDFVGSLKAVGVGGPLTGETIDVLIMDDLYKDYQDACSATVSQRVWDWFLTVAKTRLHNDSQEIIVFTRWDEQDVIGRLEKIGSVVNATDYDSLDEAIEACGKTKYLKINFEAIKTGPPNWLDSRKDGEALYPKKHDLVKLEEMRRIDPTKFSSLFQGQPRNKEGLMYQGFGEYRQLPELKAIKSYTDTADKGVDALCSIVYGVPLDPTNTKRYIIDVYFSYKAMEVTEPATARHLERNNSRINKIESNNGGRGFARNVERLTDSKCSIKWFTQTKNKESRIYTASGSVQYTMLFPEGWVGRWPAFSSQLLDYKKDGTLKKDDAADTLTGVYEEEFSRGPFYVY